MLLRLPTITNECAAASLQIMNILFSSAIFQCPTLLPLSAMCMIQLSLEFGLSAVSCVAFSLYSILLVSNSCDVCAGIRMGDWSLRLLDCFQCTSWVPCVNAIVYGFIHGWQRPIQKAFKHLICGYKIA
jgi:predicted ATPase